MSAINETFLCKQPWKVFIAPFDPLTDKIELEADGSNVKKIIAETVANKKWTRMGSIIDLKLSEDFSANTVSVEADECDTGEICRQCTPETSLEFTWYECKNPTATELITWVPVVQDTDGLSAGYKVDCINCPRVCVYVETCPDENGKIDRLLLTDVFFDGALVSNFINICRAGNLEGASANFKAAKRGCVLRYWETVDLTASLPTAPTAL